MKEIINKLKQLHIEAYDKCDSNCTKCLLNKPIFQSYSEGSVDICDCLDKICKMNFDNE